MLWEVLASGAFGMLLGFMASWYIRVSKLPRPALVMLKIIVDYYLTKKKGKK